MAGEALVMGSKSVETVQAFLLLAVYPVPKKKWTDDRSWLFMGTAIRCVLYAAYLFLNAHSDISAVTSGWLKSSSSTNCPRAQMSRTT